MRSTKSAEIESKLKQKEEAEQTVKKLEAKVLANKSSMEKKKKAQADLKAQIEKL